MRGFDGTARAGRAARNREPLQIERNDKRLTLNAAEMDIAGVRQAVRAGAVDADVGKLAQQSPFEQVPHPAQMTVNLG